MWSWLAAGGLPAEAWLWINRRIAVAIDEAIYRDNWSNELPPGAEVLLQSRLAGE